MLRKRYVNQVNDGPVTKLKNYQKNILEPAKNKRKQRDKLYLEMDIIDRSSQDYTAAELTSKRSALEESYRIADEANVGITEDAIVVQSLNELLDAQLEYHTKVLKEIAHMKNVLNSDSQIGSLSDEFISLCEYSE